MKAEQLDRTDARKVVSRRRFLKGVVGVAGFAALAACTTPTPETVEVEVEKEVEVTREVEVEVEVEVDEEVRLLPPAVDERPRGFRPELPFRHGGPPLRPRTLR